VPGRAPEPPPDDDAWGHAGDEGRARDWTPLVLLSSALCLGVVLYVLVSRPELIRGVMDGVGPAHARRHAPPSVDVWVGEVAPGLKGVLSAVWNDPEPDLLHDREINEGLDLEGEGYAFYRLLLFNTAQEERTVLLEDGALRIQEADGAPVPLLSLAERVERGDLAPSASLRMVLAALGTLRRSVTLAPGEMADLVVPFRDRVDLGTAQSVASADGTPFRRRRIARAELQRLMLDPDEARVRDL
jgi:hypothetical protein